MVFSFSAIEVLQALLDKSKTQTIRADKKPRHKVGDIVPLFWKQRSKYELFCAECGDGLFTKDEIKREVSKSENIKKHAKCFRLADINFDKREIDETSPMRFPKTLGEVEITEVFEIEMEKRGLKNPKIAMILTGVKKYIPFSERHLEIPHRDGFKNFDEMFNWFDKKYDLTQPKRFFVYRWRWLE